MTAARIAGSAAVYKGVSVKKLASPFGHPKQVSTQVQLAATCESVWPGLYTKVHGEKHGEFKKKRSDNFFATRRNITAQRDKDENCTSKRRQKQGNYFEINRFLTV